jgi:hypothetical protein
VHSIEIMEPLVKRKLHPAWLCWLALVRLVTYAVRHSYDIDEGPKKLDELANELLRAFDEVEEWVGYEKPQLHPSKHLGEQLIDFGPPRLVWCLAQYLTLTSALTCTPPLLMIAHVLTARSHLHPYL